MFSQVHLRKYMESKSNELIFVNMILGFGVAILSVGVTLFLKSQGYSNSLIGTIVAGTIFLSIVTSIFSTILLEEIDEYKLFILGITIPGFFLLLLFFYPTIEIFLIFLVSSSIFGIVRKNSFSILFKDITKIKEFTKKQSILFSTGNMGWFIGPLLGGLLLTNYGFSQLFLLTFSFYFIALFFSVFIKVKLKEKKRKKIDFNIFKNIKYFSKNKDLMKSYLIGFMSAFWYALIFTYVPLFIIEANLTEVIVGIFISLTQLPLIFIQFKLSWFVEKFGLRKLAIFSFLNITIISFLLFIFHSNIYVVLGLLLLTPFSLGFIESFGELYFFKNIESKNEEKAYPIYSTASSFGGIFGKLIMAGVLLILPQNYVYLTMGIVMGITTYLVLSLKDYRN